MCGGPWKRTFSAASVQKNIPRWRVKPKITPTRIERRLRVVQDGGELHLPQVRYWQRVIYIYPLSLCIIQMRPYVAGLLYHPD